MEIIKRVVAKPQYMLYNMMYWLANALYEPYLVMYLGTKGLASAKIGVIISLVRVVTVVGSFAIGYLSDKLQSPKIAVFVASIGAAAAVFITGNSSSLILLALGCLLYGFFSSPSLDIVDKLIVDNVENGAQLSSLFRLFGAVGYSLGALLAGALVAKLQYTTMFAYSNIISIGCVLLCFFMKSKKTGQRSRKNKVPLSKIFKSPISLYIYGCQGIWGYVEGSALSFATLFVTSSLQLDANYPARFLAMAMCGQIITFASLSLFIRQKIKPHVMICMAGILVAIRICSYAFALSLPMFVVYFCQLLGGCGYSFFVHASIVMIAESYSEEVSSTAQTLKSVFTRGIGAGSGALIFGALFDVCNQQMLMFSSGVVSLVLSVFSIVGFHLLQNKQNTVSA